MNENNALESVQSKLKNMNSRKSVSQMFKKADNVKSVERIDKILIILLDCSGRMSDQFGAHNKITVSWDVLQNQLAPNMAGWHYGIINFPSNSDDPYCHYDKLGWFIDPTDDTRIIRRKSKPQPRGATPMKAGLNMAWNWITEGAKKARFVVLTDGCPTDGRDKILELATVHKNIPIDTVGIGEKKGLYSAYDEEFLRQLSLITGGTFCHAGDAIVLGQAIKQLSPTQRPLLGMVADGKRA